MAVTPRAARPVAWGRRFATGSRLSRRHAGPRLRGVRREAEHDDARDVTGAAESVAVTAEVSFLGVSNAQGSRTQRDADHARASDPDLLARPRRQACSASPTAPSSSPRPTSRTTSPATHLFEQRRAIAARERSRPRPIDDPHADLVRDRGEEYENEQLQRLSASAAGTSTSRRLQPVHARGASEQRPTRRPRRCATARR